MNFSNFPSTFIRNVFRSKKNWERYDQKCISVFMQNTPHSCQIVMNIEFSRNTLKYPQISNFMKIRLVGAEFFHTDIRTDRQT